MNKQHAYLIKRIAMTMLALSLVPVSAASTPILLAQFPTLPLTKPPPLQPMPPIIPNSERKSAPPSTPPQQSNDHDNHQSHHDHHNQPPGINYYYSIPYYYNYPSVITYGDSYVNTTQNNNTTISVGTWVEASNGNIPEGAISYINKQGITTFHCRALYRDQMYYGEIIPNQTCVYRSDTITLQFEHYEVQVKG